MENSTLSTLTDIFRDVLDDSSIVLTEATTASDVEGWDSLSHVLLVSAIEKKLNVRFTAAEIQKLQNVGDLVRLVQSRKG